MTDTHLAAYPRRVYRVKTSVRFVGLALVIAGIFFLIVTCYQAISGIQKLTLLEMFFLVFYLSFASVFTVGAFSNWVSLTEADFEVRELTVKKILPVNRIKGRRRYWESGDGDGPGVWHLVLEPNDDRFPKIDIEDNYSFDDHFYQWFNSLPDLDGPDKLKFGTSNFGLV